MPSQKYGIRFPFKDSPEGLFLNVNSKTDDEVRSSLIHLILTVKGSRYFLPDFGTNLMKFVYEPLDNTTKLSIDNEIRDAVDKFIPNLTINDVNVKSAEDVRLEEETSPNSDNINKDDFNFGGEPEREYMLRVRIDYTAGDGFFETKDFVVINL